MLKKRTLMASAIASVFAGFAASQALAADLWTSSEKFLPFALSADGSVVVGDLTLPKEGGGWDTQAVVYTAAGGYNKIGRLANGERAYATLRGVSADGRIAVGYSGDDANYQGLAFRWQQDGGMVSLGRLGDGEWSKAFAVSGDGRVIVGEANTGGAAYMSTAVRWVDGATTPDPLRMSVGQNSRAYGVSWDGAVIVGEIAGHAYKWDGATGEQTLLDVPWTINKPGNTVARGVSFDGQVIAGEANQYLFKEGDTSLTNGETQAVRWVNGGSKMELLGVLDGQKYSVTGGISGNGEVVVGYAGGVGDQVGFRWTAASGMQTVEDWLRASGATIAEEVSGHATAANEDGSVIVGYLRDGSSQGFIARGKGTGPTGYTGQGSAPPSSGGGGENPTESGETPPAGDTGSGTPGAPDTGNAGTPPSPGAVQPVVPPLVPPVAGLITVNHLVSSLASSGAANGSSLNSVGTLLNGAGSRPLDRRVAEGKLLAWGGADLGHDDHGSRDGNLTLAEAGVGYNFGKVQINGVLGHLRLRQDTTLGGRNTIDGTFFKLEALAPLARIAGRDLWFAGMATSFWGDSRLRRNYMTNGGIVDRSSASPDIRSYGLRARLQLEDALPGVSPYGEVSHARSCLDSYVERGGAFPAAFRKLCDNVSEARYGVDGKFALNERFRLIGTLEGAHRFDRKAKSVKGQVIGLGAFDFGAAHFKRNWLRAGVGFEFDFSQSSTVSLLANGTTKGESASSWVAANWRVSF